MSQPLPPDPQDLDQPHDLDQPLRAFLHQYRSDPPPPAVDLEDRIMALIQQDSALTPPAMRRRWQLWIRRFWIPSVVIAGLTVLGGGVYGLLRPEPSLTTAELAELESFLEGTWLGILEDPQDEPVDFWKL